MKLPENAERLAKNPLGIIALFLFLVYGIAGLVLSVTTQSLTEQERFPLIVFLVGFPVLVLALFAWLVAKHHTKLYAPSDYRDSEGFFRAMSPSERRERLEREVQQLSKASGAAPLQEPRTARPASTIREQVVLAEDLALRAVEVEFGRPVLRQVRSEGRAFDGVLTLPTGDVAVEVKYTYHRGWQRIANDAIALASAFTMGKGRAGPVSLMLVVVVDSLTPEQIKQEREELERGLADSPAVSVKLRVFTLEDLKRQFGLLPV